MRTVVLVVCVFANPLGAALIRDNRAWHGKTCTSETNIYDIRQSISC
eukprot:COSAG02_NODE_3_length_74588_cov_108.368430_24_plen_47_part_00